MFHVILLGVVLACGGLATSMTPCLRVVSEKNLLLHSQGLLPLDDCSARDLTAFPVISPSERRSVTRLRLENSQLFIDDANTFLHFSSLEWVNLSRNIIPTLNDGLLDPITYLRNLDVSNCLIRTIAPSAFAKNTRLLYLDMNFNQLDILPQNVFGSLPFRAHIDLLGNPLVTDYRLCSALYSYKAFVYRLESDIQQKFGQPGLVHTPVTLQCVGRCYSWRPPYLNICPDAFCKGILGQHRCYSIDAENSLTETCNETGNVLTMASSKEQTYWQARAACSKLNGTLPTQSDFQNGCVNRLLTKVRQQFSLNYFPVAWLGQTHGGQPGVGSNGQPYPPATYNLYYMCSIPRNLCDSAKTPEMGNPGTAGQPEPNLCKRQCNTWRPSYDKACPDALCQGTVESHQCQTINSNHFFTETCPITGSHLTMMSSNESTFWEATAFCTNLNGALPTRSDFQSGCVQQLLAKIRRQLNVGYTPVVWLGPLDSYGTAYASDQNSYAPAGRRLYVMCSILRQKTPTTVTPGLHATPALLPSSMPSSSSSSTTPLPPALSSVSAVPSSLLPAPATSPAVPS
eukprot:scpid70573/ scgid19627/ 